MAHIKGTTTEQQNWFDYLEELRQSGVTNMYGAGPYLAREFGMEEKDASKILMDWMKAHADPARIIKPNPERHQSGCVCADCSGAELTADND
jgi:hypothetical protein